MVDDGSREVDDEIDVLALPFPDRRFVVVRRDDDVLPARRSIGGADRNLRETVLRSGFMAAGALTVLRATAPLILPPLTVPLIAVSVITGVVWAITPQPAPVLPITYAEARRLRLPPGHPTINVVYAANPAEDRCYYPISQFHARTLGHKHAEAIRLLTSLGATQVSVTATEGATGDLIAQIGVDALRIADVSGKVTAQRTRYRRIGYVAALVGTKPRVPNDLAWFPHEDAWREIARQRLEHGLRTFRLAVTYRDSFAVTAGLAARIRKAGLDLGGEFTEHVDTELVIAGEFARPLPRWISGRAARRRL